MRRASARERERLHETFAALCTIESPSYHERQCADWVTAQLRQIGLEVAEDGSGPAIGSDSGNLFTTVAAAQPDAPSVLICAHLDTVPAVAPIEPVLVDGYWTNANDAILGADNKSAVAVALELARRLRAKPAPIGVELLFTVCEEVSLRGSREFDVSRLRSAFGYVLDHATPIGELVMASPTHYRIVAEFRGRAAHAGVRPETGRSAIAGAARAIAAMRLGRLDAQTTANVGMINGGTAINVVPERCRVEAEVRSLDDAIASQVTTETIDHLQDAANATECDLDLDVAQMFKGYRIRSSAAQVQVAERALRSCGYEPRPIDSGGASDANSFAVGGFACMCLADGTEHNHEPTERIGAQTLETLLELTIAVVDEAAAQLAPEPVR